MTRFFAQGLLAVQLLLLMVGTQMPGTWRAGAVSSLHAPGSIQLGHILCCFSAWPLWRLHGHWFDTQHAWSYGR
jgi:hypothetical protein